MLLKEDIRRISEKFCHQALLKLIKESKDRDLSEYGKIEYETYIDEDEYAEWLQANGLEDDEESKKRYLNDEAMFDIDYYDLDFHRCDNDSVMFYEIERMFDDRIAEKIFNDCLKDGKGEIEPFTMYTEEDVDINNPYELDQMAMKILPHGDYYDNCRGFILHNGVVVYTEDEHNASALIPGVEGTFHFIDLGNIRLTHNGIDMSCMPTAAQFDTLEEVIQSYHNDELYVSFLDSSKYLHYDSPYVDMVINDIDRYYSDGKLPQDDNEEEDEDTEEEEL
jgi:hypothetical protein